MNKDIRKYNNKREFHGYNEWYSKGKLLIRANWKNGKIKGYYEHHQFLTENHFFII